MHSLFSRCVQMSRRSRFLKGGGGGYEEGVGGRRAYVGVRRSVRCLGRGLGGFLTAIF